MDLKIKLFKDCIIHLIVIIKTIKEDKSQTLLIMMKVISWYLKGILIKIEITLQTKTSFLTKLKKFKMLKYQSQWKTVRKRMIRVLVMILELLTWIMTMTKKMICLMSMMISCLFSKIYFRRKIDQIMARVLQLEVDLKVEQSR